MDDDASIGAELEPPRAQEIDIGALAGGDKDRIGREPKLAPRDRRRAAAPIGPRLAELIANGVEGHDTAAFDDDTDG